MLRKIEQERERALFLWPFTRIPFTTRGYVYLIRGILLYDYI